MTSRTTSTPTTTTAPPKRPDRNGDWLRPGVLFRLQGREEAQAERRPVARVERGRLLEPSDEGVQRREQGLLRELVRDAVLEEEYAVGRKVGKPSIPVRQEDAPKAPADRVEIGQRACARRDDGEALVEREARKVRHGVLGRRVNETVGPKDEDDLAEPVGRPRRLDDADVEIRDRPADPAREPRGVGAAPGDEGQRSGRIAPDGLRLLGEIVASGTDGEKAKLFERRADIAHPALSKAAIKSGASVR